MKFSINLDVVACRTGSHFDYQIKKDAADMIIALILNWYATLPKEKGRYVESVNVFPEFVLRGNISVTTYITVRTVFTAGTYFDKVPKGLTIPTGGEAGWKATFDHQCLTNEHLSEDLIAYAEKATKKLEEVIHSFEKAFQ